LAERLTDPPRAHPPGPAAAHQMSKWPARVGALSAGCDQQLGHGLVRALLRRRPVDFGPVEPHRVRGAVPVCCRFRRNRRIRAGSGRCRFNGRRARIGLRSHGIAVCSDLDKCYHLSVRRITPRSATARPWAEWTFGPAVPWHPPGAEEPLACWPPASVCGPDGHGLACRRRGQQRQPLPLPRDRSLQPCCTDQRCGCSYPLPRLWSGDADGDRASKLQHTVKGMDGNVHLGRPARNTKSL